MSFETVTGYCWPQSVDPGQAVSLHLSSAGGRPVEVEVARIGASREVLWSETVGADFHPTPDGADANAQAEETAQEQDSQEDQEQPRSISSRTTRGAWRPAPRATCRRACC